jgi:predicted kinase
VIVEIVHGPPGAGKATYVAKNKRDDDVVIDVDLLYSALSMLPKYEKPSVLFYYIEDVAQYALRAAKSNSRIRKIWIISSRPDIDLVKDQAKRLDATLIQLDPGMSECLKRISKDETRNKHFHGWARIIHQWYGRLEGAKWKRNLNHTTNL